VTGAGANDRALLAIDTATTRVVVAVGTLAGELIEAAEWPAGYRHGETLLPAIDALLTRRSIPKTALAAVVVGTGPGAFTGLRVGIATAKGIAHALRVPLVGVSTADALLEDAPADAVLLLPAGPSERLIARRGEPARLATSRDDTLLADAAVVVAVDLPDRAAPEALQRGEAARAGVGRALVALGASRLGAVAADDLERLVPEYVTLPRGVAVAAGEVSWSHDRR
jgi:tRNA threonylcarbamoyl adenosine modification protein YeaZ